MRQRDAVQGVRILEHAVVELVRDAFSLPANLFHDEEVLEPVIRTGRRCALGTADGQEPLRRPAPSEGGNRSLSYLSHSSLRLDPLEQQAAITRLLPAKDGAGAVHATATMAN